MTMHNVRITVLECRCYEDLQEEYLSNPGIGACSLFHPGDEFIVTPDEWRHLMHGRFCSEAWNCISKYVYAAMNGGAIKDGWNRNDGVMIACCNDGTRPVIFRIERLPERDPRERAPVATPVGRDRFISARCSPRSRHRRGPCSRG